MSQLQALRKDVTGFIAEFVTEKQMESFLNKNHIAIPKGWVRSKDNFVVVQDLGRILVLAFWDIVKDEQLGGATFEVAYEEVHCWA